MDEYLIKLEVWTRAGNKKEAIERFWEIVDNDHRALAVSVRNLSNDPGARDEGGAQ